MEGANTFDFIKLILQFGIIPLIYGVYRVDNAVRDLKFILHTDFVKHSALKEQIEELKHEIEKKENRRKTA